MQKLHFIILFILCFQFSYSQKILKKDEIKDTSAVSKAIIVKGKIENNDTVLFVSMPMMTILPKREFLTAKEKAQYDRLVYYVKHVFPYAIMIRNTFKEVKAHLDSIPQNEHKKYLKRKEKELRSKFEDELVKLTVSEGKILIKLVDRETGNSTYEILKEFRGSVAAFFWQTLAVLFGENLKSKYDPEGEDRLIEEIIQLIDNGQL